MLLHETMSVTETTSPDELMAVLKQYLKESNETEIVVASRIGVNRHTLNRWLTTSKSPTKSRLALAACFLRRVGYL
jgi:transcriptional regulator with XRE-family HTH domain